MSTDRRKFLQAAAALAVSPFVPELVPAPSNPHPHGIYALRVMDTYRLDLPQEVDLLNMVAYSLRACDDVLEAHGENCPCNLCSDVRGLAFNLEMGQSLLEGNLHARVGDVVDCPCCGQRWDDDAEAAQVPAHVSESLRAVLIARNAQLEMVQVARDEIAGSDRLTARSTGNEKSGK